MNLLNEVKRLQAIAGEYDKLVEELQQGAKHLRARSASYDHKATPDSFFEGKARAYGVGASDISFALERSAGRLNRRLEDI